MCNFGVLHKKVVFDLLNFDKIESLIEEKGVKKTHLTDKINKSRYFFNNLKAGKTRITDNEIEVWADLLDTTPEYLTDKTDKKEKPSTYSAEHKIIISKLEKLSPEKLQEASNYLDFLLSNHNK